MKIIYNNEEETEYRAPQKIVKESKSTLANWMVKKGFVKTPKGAEKIIVLFAFIIFVIAAMTFSYGIGVNKIKDLEDGNTEYLDKK